LSALFYYVKTRCWRFGSEPVLLSVAWRPTVACGVLRASDHANGTACFQEFLLGYHGKPIRPPLGADWKPELGHLEWQGREVFKGEARHRISAE
jgi:hypothetical protein